MSKATKYNRKPQNQVNLMKNVIVHATTAKIIVTKRYMHLCHAWLVMTNVLVKILLTVQNLTIGSSNSIMPSLLSEEEMEAMVCGDESDHDIISKEI